MSRDIRVCLFIGGHCDGERRQVDVLREAVFEAPAALFGGYSDTAPLTATRMSEAYVRHPFQSGDGQRGISRTDYIYVAQGLNPLAELLDGYVARKDRVAP